MENIFTDDFLEEIGFAPVTEYENEDFEGNKTTYKVSHPYGRAIDKRGNMTILTWNLNGPSITYYKEPVEKGAIYFEVRKDGGGRVAFNGYVWTQEEVRTVLNFTW